MRRRLQRRFSKRNIDDLKLLPRRTLGTSEAGRVLLGHVRFKDRPEYEPVAVRDLKKASELSPVEFNTMVSRLRHARVKLLETAAVKWGNRWYQVMELFKQRGEAKFLNREESAKRFKSLTMKEKPLVERLARDYAAVFNCGYCATIADLEHYFTTKGGKEGYYFVNFKSLEKANWAKPKEMKNRMAFFYSDVCGLTDYSIADLAARDLFIKEFGKSLKPNLQKVWKKVANR